MKSKIEKVFNTIRLKRQFTNENLILLTGTENKMGISMKIAEDFIGNNEGMIDVISFNDNLFSSRTDVMIHRGEFTKESLENQLAGFASSLRNNERKVVIVDDYQLFREVFYTNDIKGSFSNNANVLRNLNELSNMCNNRIKFIFINEEPIIFGENKAQCKQIKFREIDNSCTFFMSGIYSIEKEGDLLSIYANKTRYGSKGSTIYYDPVSNEFK